MTFDFEAFIGRSVDHEPTDHGPTDSDPPIYNAIMEYEPAGPTVESFHRSDAPIRVLLGPVGSGKTGGSLVELIRRVCETPVQYGTNVRKSRWFIVRQTFGQLESATIKDYLELYGELGAFRKGKHYPYDDWYFGLEDGTVVEAHVMFLAFDRPEHIAKIRGLQTTGGIVDEIKELQDANLIPMLYGRTGRFPHKKSCAPFWGGLWGASQPPDEGHFLVDWYENPPTFSLGDDTAAAVEVFLQPGGVIEAEGGGWALNPDAENLENLEAGYYAKQLAINSEDSIRVNLAAMFGAISTGRRVHPRFSRALHTLGSIDFDPTKPLFIGADQDRNRGVVFVQRHGTRFVAIREFQREDMSMSDFAPELRRFIEVEFQPSCDLARQDLKLVVYLDPAGTQRGQATDDTVKKMLEATGFPVVTAPSRNDPNKRRAAVDTPLRTLHSDGKPNLLVSRKGCPDLVAGLSGKYRFRRIASPEDEKYTAQPIKNSFASLCEALQYCLQCLGAADDATSAREPGFASAVEKRRSNPRAPRSWRV